MAEFAAPELIIAKREKQELSTEQIDWLIANYTTGNVASLPVREDGSLGEAVSFFQHTGSSVDLPRQKGPNAHAFVVSPDNRFAFAPGDSRNTTLFRIDIRPVPEPPKPLFPGPIDGPCPSTAVVTAVGRRE